MSLGLRSAPSGYSTVPLDEAALLAGLRRYGAPFQRVIFTENRRVMASTDAARTTVRLHRSFAAAPPTVLEALARMWAPGVSGRSRQAAATVVREFIRVRPAAAAARVVPRTRRIAPGDRGHLDGLCAEFERVNQDFFGGCLPLVPLFLSGRMQRRNGHFTAEPLEIVISRRLCEHGAPGEAAQTLRHEMIHLWQHRQGLKPDHGAEFRDWARRLGVHPRACREVEWAELPIPG